MASLINLTNTRAGYGTMTGPCGTTTYESDTATCRHCNYVWIVRSTRMSDADPGGWCALCRALICKHCAGKPCEPFEKKLDQIEARDRMMRAMEA